MSQLQCARERLYPEKCRKVSTKVTPSQRSSLFHTAGFSGHCYEMSENRELRRNRDEPGHARC